MRLLRAEGLFLVAAALMLGLSAFADSEASDRDEATAIWAESIAESSRALQLTGRPEEGRALYQVCAECHLPSGAGVSDGTMPQLAGQHRSVVIKQMLDIRSGRRRNAAMYPYAASFEGLQPLADLAAHIESLPVPPKNGTGPGILLSRGRALYEEDCARCHGASGEGLAEAFYPSLQGQHYLYLVRQLIDIAGGRRGNAHPEMVAAIQDFTARDVATVADYVSRLKPRPVSAKGNQP